MGARLENLNLVSRISLTVKSEYEAEPSAKRSTIDVVKYSLSLRKA